MDTTDAELVPIRADNLEIPFHFGAVQDVATNILLRVPAVSDATSLPMLAPIVRTFAASPAALENLRTSNRKFRNPGYLVTISLNQLGQEIVQEVHGQMHIRMCMQPYQKAQWSNLRPNLSLKEMLGVDKSRTHNPAWLWNDPRYYDYMFDGYADLAAPAFWYVRKQSSCTCVLLQCVEILQPCTYEHTSRKHTS